MNGYGNRLNKEEMEAVVDYIRTAFMRVEGTPGITLSTELKSRPLSGISSSRRISIRR